MRIEISRRAGLDPPVEMNRPLLTRKADELCDAAACEAIVGPLAGQDPPYGSARNSLPEAAAACLKGSVSGTVVPEQGDVPLRDMDRERSDSVPTLGLRLCLANASIQHGNHALSLHAFGLPTTIAGRREWRW